MAEQSATEETGGELPVPAFPEWPQPTSSHVQGLEVSEISPGSRASTSQRSRPPFARTVPQAEGARLERSEGGQGRSGAPTAIPPRGERNLGRRASQIRP